MELKDQVCTLEQAKRLKELGVEWNAGTIFWWVKDSSTPEWKIAFKFYFKQYDTAIPAFTVAELGELLDYFSNFVTINAAGKWMPKFEHATIDKHERNMGTGTTQYSTWHDTEAQARAALLIYLLENKLINLK